MADEIGQAMQRVGGTAGALNVEFEKVASWVAVVSSRTRESSYTIGNSIKSLMARIQSMKEYGYDEEDGTQVNMVAKSLAQVGVQLIDAQGQFRNFGTVMDELGERWKNIDSRTRAYIATTVNFAVFKPSLINWETPNVKTRAIHNKQKNIFLCAVATTEREGYLITY